MKNIGILGYGTVGRATAKHLAGSWERQLVAFDERRDYAKHVNTGARVNLEDGARLDALIVCINIPHPFALSASTQASAAAAIRLAMNEHVDVPLRETAPILVRTTVPPGTCELLQLLFPNNPVLYWPEFAKEASMRQGYEIKALYLGLSETSGFDEDRGDGRVLAGLILNNTSLVVGAEIPDCVYTNKQVEFAKLAWNVKRAADVAVFNELTRGAIALGIDPVMAEHLAENAKPHAPQFSTLAYGGKCLDKDLYLWDTTFNSTFGHTVRAVNSEGPRRAIKTLQRAYALMGIAEKRVVILGLQDGPSSGACAHSPAMLVLKAQKWEHAPAMVDSVKAIREKFQWLLDKSKRTRQIVAAPDDEALVNTNAIIIAQKSHGPVIFNSLMRVLQASQEPLKIVVNACNMQLQQHQVIAAQQWGAVFVDQIEIDRMRKELDDANRSELIRGMIS